MSDVHDGDAVAAEWDERYTGADRLWSGEPNGALVGEVAGLPAGRALDVGCGEGADAIWLASNGWTLTAVDVSGVALDRARAHAATAEVDIAWIQAGLLDADLPRAGFDLVTAQYPALRRTGDSAAEHALIDAVAPGGVLLVVHHDMHERTHAFEHGFDPDEWVSPRDVANLLDADWTIVFDERRERSVTGGAGAHHTHDVVLRATRGAADL
jgi:SAM-dependent methyltransferase